MYDFLLMFVMVYIVFAQLNIHVYLLKIYVVHQYLKKYRYHII